MRGNLYLVPVPIGNGLPARELATMVIETVKPIRDFVVENQRTALRILSRIMEPADLQLSSLMELSEHTTDSEVPALLAPLLAGRDVAILSEAGSPCIADPGARLVRAAHNAGIKVYPLPGPVSLMLALMASGFDGQKFSFSGYLPVPETDRRKALLQLEARACGSGESCLFIETPYRNDALIKTALSCLHPSTLLCVAAGLCGPEQAIVSQSIAEWKKQPWLPGKIPAVFILASGNAASVPAHRNDRQNSCRSTNRSATRPADQPGSRRQHKKAAKTAEKKPFAVKPDRISPGSSKQPRK